MIAIDLRQQQALDPIPKATQQINFTGNLEWPGNSSIFFIFEQVKQIMFSFSKRTLGVLWIYHKNS